MPTTLGLHSPKLAEVRALRTKAGRREQQRFAIEGATLLDEALRAGRQPEATFATEAAYERLGALAERLEGPVYLVPERAMGKLSDVESPQGIVAVLPWRLEGLAGLLADPGPVILLAGIADPGNAGTLLRSADAFGLPRLIFAADGVEPYHPKVVRASMGAIFRTRFTVGEPAAVVAAAREHGFVLVAAAREGVPLPDFRFPKKSVIAIGNERRGVAGWLPRWDLGVAIPQRGEAESLNAGVAGSIILYACAQQFGP